MELKNENFKEEIKEGITLVDFYATWCGPCKMMHPVIDKIEEQYKNIKVIKIDVDSHEDLAHEYGVMSIPTLYLMKDGKPVEKNIGFTQQEKIEDWIKNQEK